MKIMIQTMKKYWIFGLIASLLMVVEVSMDLVQPQMMSRIVDEGVLGLSNGGVSDLSVIIQTGIRMVIVLLIGGCGGVLCGVFENRCSQNFANDIRKQAFSRVLSFSLQQTDQFSTGSLITRVTNDVNQIQLLVRECVRGVVRTMMLMCGGIFCMLMLDISFGVVIACTLPVIVVAMYFFITRSSPRFEILQGKLDQVNNVMQENVAGARVVKAYVQEEHETQRFGKANTELADTQMQILVFLSYMTPLMNIVMNMAVVFIIRIGGIRVEAGAITPGSVMAAITYTTQILNAALRMAMIFQSLSRGMASVKRVNEILRCEPVIADGPGIRADDHARGGASAKEDCSKPAGAEIAFHHVSFSYPGGSGEEILHDIDLTIQPGETIGIMGMTGCGKSTLIHLIPRFYDATQGEVCINGVNVKEYPLQELRGMVSIALQKSEIFAASIRENILWGAPQADEAAVEEAAEMAQAMEFIRTRPEGMDAQIYQAGAGLSGGQKQRLAIARAVIRDAQILILDDATSALDLKTEAALFAEMGKKNRGQTRIIVAQRIASVKNADRILILDEKSIAACGSHEELLLTSPIYREIYQSQMGGVPDGGI